MRQPEVERPDGEASIAPQVMNAPKGRRIDTFTGLRGLAQSPELLGAVALAAFYAAGMSGHLHSIDGYLMWQQARALAFHQTLLFEPPINWNGLTFSTSYFAIGLSLLYLPGLLALSWTFPQLAYADVASNGLLSLYGDEVYTMVGAPVHVFVSAAAAYMVARLLRQLGFGMRTALCGLFVYGVSSLALTYSHGDWAQPLEGLCWIVAISAAVAVRESGSRRATIVCGLAVLLAVLTRTLEGAVLVPGVLLILAGDVRIRSWTGSTLWSAAAVLTSFGLAVLITLLIDYWRYGNPLQTGYGVMGSQDTTALLWSTPLMVGLAGALVSPARGLIWNMPWVILLPAGLRIVWHRDYKLLAVALAIVLTLLLAMTATWFVWWGGVDWGLRLFLPGLPLVAVVSTIGATSVAVRRRWLLAVLFLVGAACALPGFLTDVLGGYGGLVDGTEGSFRLDGYPAFGAWQFVKHVMPTTMVDTAGIDVIWLRLASQTGNASVLVMVALLGVAAGCAWRAWTLTSPIPIILRRPHTRIRVHHSLLYASRLWRYRLGQTHGSWRELARARVLTWGSLIGLVAIGAALRLHHIGHFSLWLDEVIQYGWATASLGSILFQLQPDQMFLNAFLSHLLIQLHFGEFAWQLRLPSAVFGIATILVMSLLARELFGAIVGLLTGTLTALWPALIVYSQEYRPYAFEVLLSSMMLLFLVKGYRTNWPGWWAYLAISAILCLYNHMTSVLGVAGVMTGAFLWIFMDAASDTRRIRAYVVPRAVSLVMTLGLVLAGFIPGILIVANFIEKTASNPAISGVKAPLSLNATSLVMIFGKYLGLGDGVPLVVTGGLAVIGMVRAARQQPHAAVLTLTCIGVPLMAYTHMAGGGSVLNSQRYVLYIIPMYLVMISLGAATFARLIARLLDTLAVTERRVAVGSANRVKWDMRLIAMPLCFGLLAYVPASALPGIYQNNPKEIPVDLAGAYEYVLEHISPGDMLLETSIATNMPSGWFGYYDEFFMRKEIRPSNVVIARFGRDFNHPELLCLTLEGAGGQAERACVAASETDQPEAIAQLPEQLHSLKHARGQVWVMVTTAAGEGAAFASSLAADGTSACYQSVCVFGGAPGDHLELLPQVRQYLVELTPRVQ